MQLLGFLSLVLLTGGPDAERVDACLIEIVPLFTRPAHPSYVVVKPTPDTVSVGVYYRTVSNEGVSLIPAVPSLRGTEVFGQVLELLSAYGPEAERLSLHRRIVVVWWSVGATCQRSFPRAARRLTTGEAFLLQRPRPPVAWIAGLPTYDVDVRDYVYSPATSLGGVTGGGAPRHMSARELAEMFPFLPTQEELDRDRSKALAPILAWGRADPERWTWSPANRILCWALGLATQWSAPCPP